MSDLASSDTIRHFAVGLDESPFADMYFISPTPFIIFFLDIQSHLFLSFSFSLSCSTKSSFKFALRNLENCLTASCVSQIQLPLIVVIDPEFDDVLTTL